MVAAENNMVDIAYLLLNEYKTYLVTLISIDVTIKIYLCRNINVNQTCAGGKTALMAAAEKGSTEMVRLLLDHNANVDLSDEQDMNALHYAALHDNPKMLKVRDFVLEPEVVTTRFFCYSSCLTTTLTKAPWMIRITWARFHSTLLPELETWRL